MIIMADIGDLLKPEYSYLIETPSYIKTSTSTSSKTSGTSSSGTGISQKKSSSEDMSGAGYDVYTGTYGGVKVSGAGSPDQSYLKPEYRTEAPSYIKTEEEPVSGEFVYETSVKSQEQVADIKSWAKEEGATVERQYAGSEEEAREQAGKGIKLLIKSSQPLPENIAIKVRSEEQIRQERASEISRVAGKKIYEEAGTVEKAVLHLQTFLSSYGYQYTGAAAKETMRAQKGPVARVANVVTEIALPGKETPEEVVVRNISEKLARHSLGEYSYTYDLPIAGKVVIDERIVEAVNNPAIDVLTMATGGAGLAKVASTKVGGKVISSTAGKAVLVGAGGVYVASVGAEVYTLRERGEGTEALGRIITAASGLAAGAAAYKVQAGHIISTAAPKEVEIDLSYVKGASISKQTGKVTVSAGKFEVVEGKLKGLAGESRAVVKDREGGLVVHIPEQKVGKFKIEEALEVRHTSAREPIKTPAGTRIYAREAAEGRVFIEETPGPLVGRHVDKTLLKETARVSTQDLVIRKMEGINLGKSWKDIDVYIARKGDRVVLVESKGPVEALRAARIDWVDITRIERMPGPEVRSFSPPSPSAAPKGPVAPREVPRMAPKIEAPAVPSGKIKILVRAGPAVRAGISPGRAGIRGRQEAAVRSALKSASIERAAQKSRIAPVQTPATSSASQSAEAQRVKYTPVPPVFVPTQGSLVTGTEEAAVKKVVAPIFEEIGGAEVPVVTVNPPPTGVFPPVFVPFIRMGGIGGKIKRFRTGHIKNPVPDIEKVI